MSKAAEPASSSSSSAAAATTTATAAPAAAVHKIALVTGGNKGIGFAAVKLIAKIANTTVILTARQEKDGKAAVEELNKQGLNNVSYQLMDVSDIKSIESGVAALLTKHKRIDWLVNNAGILPDGGVSAFETKLSDINNTFNTNTIGPFRLCQLLIPGMRDRKYGRVVNVSSGMGQISDMNGETFAYRVSKAGLNVITRVFADEINDAKVDVLINSMCPGFVATDMTKPMEAMGRKPTLTPEQGADTAVWLLQQPNGGHHNGFFRFRKPIAW